MHVIRARNVAEALSAGLAYLLEHGAREESRAGPVLVAPGPVATVYEQPTERVLFSAVRDANPFLHLMESLWMLQGRDDVAFLNRFVGDFGARFGEADGRLHGAYGHRWRRALGFDQLDAVVKKLRANPQDRQAVIQMWDATPDHEGRYFAGGMPSTRLDIGSDDLRGAWADRPCNTHIYLRVREECGHLEKSKNFERSGVLSQTINRVLDITVLCRSNDIVWGAYGANAVHFSVLQEYLAARIGVGVGRYTQVSNNFHAYESELGRLLTRVVRPFVLEASAGLSLPLALQDQRYGVVRPDALVDNPSTFDDELRLLLAVYEGSDPTDLEMGADHSTLGNLLNGFLHGTVFPMLMAHRAWRAKDVGKTDRWLHQIEAADWCSATTEWIQRRRK